MPKPIQTRYKGYRFRSRLEARWAVFFDDLRIPYHYELEGFDLDGVSYLPDFYLPSQDPSSWIEVKPRPPADYSEWKQLLGRVIRLAQFRREHVITIMGEPFPGQYSLYWVGYHREAEMLSLPRVDVLADQKIVFAESDCGAVHLAHIDPSDRSFFTTIRLRPPLRDCQEPDQCMMHIYDDASPALPKQCPGLWSAFNRARGARFEHGEVP